MESSTKPMVTATVTLPQELRDRLDQTAAAMERSRSWMVTKAVAQFLSQLSDSGRPLPRPNGDQSDSAPPNNNPDDRRGGLLLPRPVPLTDQDTHMDTPTNTRADPLRGAYGLHADTLTRAADLARQRAAEEQRQAEDTHNRNAEYLKGYK
jgi:CopG-like RHH_1 or ribbon-helix-helix domain, RHH_5